MSWGVKVTCTHSQIIQTTFENDCFYESKFSNGTPYSHMEILFWFKHSSKVIYLAFNKVLLLVMFNGSPRNDTMVFLIPGSSTMNSSLKLYWEPLDEALFRYRGTKLLELSNCCSVINTQSRWANFILISLLVFYKKYMVEVPRSADP